MGYMKETGSIEWKSSWHDDYLKWIAGFANSNGGTLVIGKDDNGNVTGIDNVEKLLELLPNKMRDLLGIVPELQVHASEGKEYIEILVPRYTIPISVRGQFYCRSGSTLQELRGAALTEFLLKRVGRTWDDTIDDAASLHTLDEASIDQFRADAAGAGRLPNDVLRLPTDALLQKLRLMDEQGRLKRAAVVLFGQKPFHYHNMVVKLGRFKTDSHILFQEVEEGNLISLLREVPAQLDRKFFVKPIHFEGMRRIERGEYPVAAIREALLNALIHRDYLGTSVQLRVYDNMFTIWNEGLLSEGLTLEALRRHHPSRPRNPLIADVCFKGGYIDAWGRGTLTIFDTCAEAGLPEPEMKEEDGGMIVRIFKNDYSRQNESDASLSRRQKEAVALVQAHGMITSKVFAEHLGISISVAREELSNMNQLGILKKIGSRGPSVHFVLC